MSVVLTSEQETEKVLILGYLSQGLDHTRIAEKMGTYCKKVCRLVERYDIDSPHTRKKKVTPPMTTGNVIDSTSGPKHSKAGQGPGRGVSPQTGQKGTNGLWKKNKKKNKFGEGGIFTGELEEDGSVKMRYVRVPVGDAVLLERVPEEYRGLIGDLVDEYHNESGKTKCSLLTAIIKACRDLADMKSGGDSRPREYKRPWWLVKKQESIVDAIVNGESNITVHGDRQTGKDASTAVGVSENIVSLGEKWYFMASKKDTAIEILKKMFKDGGNKSLVSPYSHKKEKMFDYIQPWIKDEFYGKGEIVFYNALGETTSLTAIDTTEAAVKGITGNLWIDDLDTIIADHKEKVVTKALAISRSDTALRVIITSNMGDGTYRNLLDLWERKYPNMMQIFELLKGDVNFINEEKDEFLYDTMTVLGGKGEAEAQLRNQANMDSVNFNKDMINRAFENYISFIDSNPISDRNIMVLDPSGDNHPMAWMVFGSNKTTGFMWVKECDEIQLGSPVDNVSLLMEWGANAIWTVEHIIIYLARKMHYHRCNQFFTENNQNGASIAVSLGAKGFETYYVGFGKPQSYFSHQNKIFVAKWLFQQDRIGANSEELQRQLQNYDPIKSKSTKTKGDLADCFVHGVWEIADGVRVIQDHRISDTDLPKLSSSVYARSDEQKANCYQPKKNNNEDYGDIFMF